MMSLLTWSHIPKFKWNPGAVHPNARVSQYFIFTSVSFSLVHIKEIATWETSLFENVFISIRKKKVSVHFCIVYWTKCFYGMTESMNFVWVSTVSKEDGVFDRTWPAFNLRLSVTLVLFGIILEDLSIIVMHRAQSF